MFLHLNYISATLIKTKQASENKRFPKPQQI
nr:MAG TPA: hypothetical protein [Caudoviricetes sp.]